MTSIFSKKNLDRAIKQKKTDQNKSLTDDEQNNNQHSEYADVMSLALDDIKKTIPHNATNIPDKELQKTHTEWRWRFYDINNRKMVEISKQELNKDRIFINNTGHWVTHSLDSSLDKYIVDSRYCYNKA